MIDRKVIELQSATVRNIVEQAQAIQQTFEMAMKMYEEIQTVKSDVDDFKKEMNQFRQEFRDENRLLPSEIDDLYEANRKRSIEIVQSLGIQDDEEFKLRVGKVRRLIWRKLNKKFGVSKYIHIKRKHFEDAMEFINTFCIEDHI